MILITGIEFFSSAKILMTKSALFPILRKISDVESGLSEQMRKIRKLLIKFIAIS